MPDQLPEAVFPIFPIPTKDPDITLLGWVVTTDPARGDDPPASAGVSATDPETWPEDFDGIEDQLLNALRHADGRRVVIDIRFADD